MIIRVWCTHRGVFSMYSQSKFTIPDPNFSLTISCIFRISVAVVLCFHRCVATMNNERRTPLHGGELLSFSGTIQHEDHRIDPASFGPSSPIETSLLHRCTQVEALSKESRKPSSLVRLTFPFFFFCSISFLNCMMGCSRPQRPTEPPSTEARLNISFLPFANG